MLLLAEYKQTAEHLTSANLGKSKLSEALPLPSTASESSTSAYAEALIKKQEERQKIPKGDRSNSTFKEDTDLPEMFRARLEDYFRSGYDRGHMVRYPLERFLPFKHVSRVCS